MSWRRMTVTASLNVISMAQLGTDSYKLAQGGRKLTKESAEKILPDLKEIVSQLPPDAPILFYCLANTSFKAATAEGELTNISKCVVEDDGYHVNGALVVAPDIFVKHQAGLLKKLVRECGEHAVFILCPVPRYATFRCCDDPNH